MDCPVGPTLIIGQDFHDAAAAKTMQRFGLSAHFSQLRCIQRVPDVILDARRKRFHVGPGVGEPNEPFMTSGSMPILA
jgi:hypothetical protein